MMDSVTRFAMAAREVGLAAGEPPPPEGTRPRFFLICPGFSSGLGVLKQAVLQEFTLYWSKVMILTSQWPMLCAPFWTDTLS